MSFPASDLAPWALDAEHSFEYDNVSTCASDMAVELSSEIGDDLPEAIQPSQLEQQQPLSLAYLSRE
jgi:hypothetical protein